MEKIALITDSACDISADIAKENNIKILPFKIIFSNKEYDDGIDITPNMLYELLKKEIPTTSLPSVDRFTNALNEAKNVGYTHAIIITISSGLSGAYNAARLAAENVSGIQTFVFDSMTLTMSQGAIVLETANLIKEGKPFKEIIDILPTLKNKIDVFFTIDTLEYLKKGGRIGKVAGTIADALNLKPIITVGNDGIYHTVCKIRGIKQSISRLATLLKPYLENNKCKVWVLDGNAPDKAEMLYDSIKDLPNLVECTLGGMIGPALGVHTGPGLVGFIVENID
ncbi:DegV family protein [Clostridium saccharobutylicum]|uniref:DegV domain-containing protein n=1 Tax=Clostridium saccharobutylicum DSM 13864 TaxID=1345695 RepID=U5MKU7_CLOSA|nr:DegV family protein [Clostridium saccharobutylicum]AGX41158.1 DegV domain-containing protein [Clostridium saccharobutylicum DSM 13864]AQR88444.1 DegV domain-containing protein [Clostridium saccharobutylicum]AQR98342.1 DegV domain-containing protein [Clostridium saccharobutylicum]AQS08051.1 DegV domain-containing protein [Clostridium saccharobutylicum]AQS12332.1 DegV domain-containing protein [Clostridium saccharobutylicum]